MCSPRARPWVVPVDGQHNSPGTAMVGAPGSLPVVLGEGGHPLAGEGVGEADAVAVGDDDVGVV